MYELLMAGAFYCAAAAAVGSRVVQRTPHHLCYEAFWQMFFGDEIPFASSHMTPVNPSDTYLLEGI